MLRLETPPVRDQGCDVDSPQSDSGPSSAQTATEWFASELAPHEAALRAYLHGIARPSDIDDLVQETYTRI